MHCSSAGHVPQALGRQALPERIAALRIDVAQGTPDTRGTQRIVMLQGREPAPVDSPCVSPSLPPRLCSESSAVDEYEWKPTFTQLSEPSETFSPELAYLHARKFWSADPREPEGMVFVRQSEGRVSASLPLVSVEFMQCSAFLFRNEKGESLMFHHDTTVRSEWGNRYAAIGGVPTSPSTPRRGLMYRRSPLMDFIDQGQRVRMVLIESERAGDRRELFDMFRSKGVDVLPPVVLETRCHGARGDKAKWDVAYRPDSDELMVHVKDGDESRVMHWQGVLSLREDGSSPVPLLREVPPEEGDIVDRLPLYRALLADPNSALAQPAREVLRLCVQAVELRNEAPPAGFDKLQELFNRPGIPRYVSKLLAKADLHERGSLALKALTYLAEFTLPSHTHAPLVPFDLNSDSDSDSDRYSDSDSGPRADTDSDTDTEHDPDAISCSAPLSAQQPAERTTCSA